MHTGLSINELAPGGRIDPHVHSFEESFYVLSGEALVTINGSGYRVVAGDYAAVKVGTPHAWRAVGPTPARWLQMAAPQPKPIGAERDTFFLKDRSIPSVRAATGSAGPERESAGPFRRRPDPAGGAAAAVVDRARRRVSQVAHRRRFRRAASPAAVHRVPARRSPRAARPHVRRVVLHPQR